MINIQLVPATAEDLNARAAPLVRGMHEGFSNLEEAKAAIGDVLATLLMAPRPDPWGAYWAHETDLDAYVGLCAFKTAPNAEGAVEIAYFTFPHLEGRGAATGMALALTGKARDAGAQLVTANTLPERNASGRVLVRSGFTFIGPATDPEDGLVWAWSRRI